MSDIYYKICTTCSYNCGASEWRCPKCGQGKFRMEFRESTTISGGPGTVEFPVFSDDPKKVKITIKGDITVQFASTKKNYTFSDIRAEKKDPTHFIKIRTKENPRQGNYLDIIFGLVKDGNHSHMGHKVSPAVLFHENRISSDATGEFLFDKDDGGFIPLQKIIRDVSTNVNVRIEFILNPNTGKIDLVDIKFI